MKDFFIAFVIFSITNSIFLWRSTGRLIRANKMRYLLIPLVIASLACGATLQENNLPDAVTQSSTVTTTSEPILKYIVTAETLQYRDGAGEEFTALGYLSQNEIVTCSDIEPAVDGGLWCKHEKGYSNIRYMVQK